MSFLKSASKTIMEFNLNDGDFLVYEPNLLPFPLRDNVIDSRKKRDYKSFARNYSALMNFFRGRCLSVKRENAKKILNALHLSQKEDDDAVVRIMVLCKALSVTDNYWISNDSDEAWENVNLRENPLHETISQIALTGISPLTIAGRILTPECTAQGAYAKTWRRENGELYLYKSSKPQGLESEIETEVSNILDFTNVPHVHYDFLKEGDLRLCRCKNMCSDRQSIVSAEDVFAWCSRCGKDFDAFVRELDSENYFKTLIVDYLISNSDRHMENWGFYMDNETGELTGLHPLYDHNNAFDKNEMSLPDGGDSLMLPNLDKRTCAKFALGRCGFKLSHEISESVFLNREHFESFKKKAERLNIRALSMAIRSR